MSIENQPVTLPETFDPLTDIFSAIVLTPDGKLKAAFSKTGQSEFTSFLSLEQVQLATDLAWKLFVDSETNSEATRDLYCRMDSTLDFLSHEIKARDKDIQRREVVMASYKQRGLNDVDWLENVPPFFVGYERVSEDTYTFKAVDHPSFWIIGRAELQRNGLGYEYSKLDKFQELLPPPAASKLAFIPSGNAGGSPLATPTSS